MGQWADWGPCSVTCHNGTRTRHRVVDVPPQHNGTACESDTETGSCDRGVCPQDCTVTQWSSWETCSRSCGKGLKIRRRDIDTINPGAEGYLCPALNEHRHCNDHRCPQNCIEGPFSNWGTCTVQCGGNGWQTRTRTVVMDAQYGGLCLPAMENRTCGTQECAVDCVVEDWGNWGGCSKNCGHGVQVRSRGVTTEPQHGGTACGARNETKSCSFGACGCSNVFCKFEEHGLFGVDSIQVGHHKAEQKGSTHVCGVNPTDNSCECFCGKVGKLGTFEEELAKRGIRGDAASTGPATLPSRQDALRSVVDGQAGRRSQCEIDDWAGATCTEEQHQPNHISHPTKKRFACQSNANADKEADMCVHRTMADKTLGLGTEKVQYGANKDSAFLSQLTWGPVVSQAEAAASST